jgi:hypothetical protein
VAEGVWPTDVFLFLRFFCEILQRLFKYEYAFTFFSFPQDVNKQFMSREHGDLFERKHNEPTQGENYNKPQY